MDENDLSIKRNSNLDKVINLLNDKHLRLDEDLKQEIDCIEKELINYLKEIDLIPLDHLNIQIVLEKFKNIATKNIFKLKKSHWKNN